MRCQLIHSTTAFLPRDASAEHGYATVSRPSVRLSVRP